MRGSSWPTAMSAATRRHAAALAMLLLAAGAAIAAPGPEQAGESDQPTQPPPTEVTPPPADVKTPAEEAKPPSAEAKPAATPAPRNIQPIDRSEALSILGKKVTGPGGENMGRIVDVLVDGESRPRAAVIDFGGFLGVGNRRSRSTGSSCSSTRQCRGTRAAERESCRGAGCPRIQALESAGGGGGAAARAGLGLIDRCRKVKGARSPETRTMAAGRYRATCAPPGADSTGSTSSSPTSRRGSDPSSRSI